MIRNLLSLIIIFTFDCWIIAQNIDISNELEKMPNQILHFSNNADYDYFAGNNILMWIGNNGMGSHNPHTGQDGFYWPGGDSATIPAIFADGLVWGGKVNGEIRVNGNTYRNGLQPGRILEDGKVDNSLSFKVKYLKSEKTGNYFLKVFLKIDSNTITTIGLLKQAHLGMI